MALIIAAISTVGMVRADGAGLRAVFAFALIWVMAGQYFLHWGMWSATLPGDATLSTGLEFYRREIKRRGLLFPRVRQWSLGPLVVSIGAWIPVMMGMAKSRGLPVRVMMPFLTLFAIWMIALLVVRRRQGKELQREIEELDGIERPSGR